MDKAVNQLKAYTDEQGKAPYVEWLRGLRDRAARYRIVRRLDRLALGLPGDVRPIGDGLSELRVPYGPGYRVYYGQEGSSIILLLCGGDKSTQARDIARAKAYWQDHKRRHGK